MLADQLSLPSIIRTALCAGLFCIASAQAQETQPHDVEAQAMAGSAPSTAPPPYLTQADVEAAEVKLKADPNLAQEKTVRSLRWIKQDKKPEKPDKPKSSKSRDGFGKWIRDLFSFLGQTGRVIVWLALAAAAGILVIVILRIVRSVGPIERAEKFVAPTHVRDLDIRPESLPEDIGAAALSLWQKGEQRAALALLYRGVLSRLVHGFKVPIRQSSTEGDCIELAGRHIGERSEYVTRLIAVWQRAVYGAQLPTTPEVESLCTSFSATLAVESNASAAT